MEVLEIEEKKFRKRLMGYNPNDVEAFLQYLAEEIRGIKDENESLQKTVRTIESELKEHKEREKTIRAVLITAHKSAEQVKTNAEREAKLLISEAEVKAEGIIQEAGSRLARIEHEISEMRRNRIQFGAKMRSLLDTFRHMLDEEGKEAVGKAEKEDLPEQI